MNRITHFKVNCPHCGNNDLIITGAEGAGWRSFISYLLLGWLISRWVFAKTIADNWPINYKCKKCNHKFTGKLIKAPQEEMLSAPCIIEFERISGFVGAWILQIVHLNGVKIAPIKNGKTITFQTHVKHNVLFVTDEYGNAFPEPYTFEAKANTSVLVRFNRKFKEVEWRNLSNEEEARVKAMGQYSAAPLPVASGQDNMYESPYNKAPMPDKESSDEALSDPTEYNGIQLYFKVLRQYADFSGRARRKEYWMFMLFNMIFSFVWSFLLTLVMILIYGDIENTTIAYYYSVAVILPGIAVSVRRLHDTGKSGWWMLIGLIPIVGGIWLFILMLADSQPKANDYGQNPKTSPRKFSEHAKLKSAGVTLIVASAVVLLMNVFNMVSFGSYGNNFYYLIPRMISLILLIAAGIFLSSEKQISPLREAGRNAMMMLLIASALFFLMRCVGLFQSIGGIRWNVMMFGNYIYTLLYLLIACFAASILFMPQNKKHIRIVTICVIVFSGVHLLWEIFASMEYMSGYTMDPMSQISYLSNILLPIAYIILAWTYLSGKKTTVPASIPVPVSIPAKAHIHENVQLKENVQEKVGNTVYGNTARMYYYLEHKVEPMSHKAAENQRISAEHVEIGRDSGCEVRLDERFTTVSRRHAAITKDGSYWKLIPLSQTNATFVNGIRVHKEWFLKHNDEIQCAINGPVLVFKDTGLR